MSADPNAYTWEDILRAVTIPGRPDRLYHLQHQWYKALQVLDVVSKALREIRSQVDDHKWTGPGADAYRKHFDQMIKSIDNVYSDASSMMDIAETLAVNLASAISSIPCPNWSTAHNKDWDNPWQYYIDLTTANDRGGEMHYQYFTDHRDRYNSHGIKSYFEYWMQQRSPISGLNYYNSGGKQALSTWYAKNTQQARNAFSSLIATYQDCSYSMPDLSHDMITFHEYTEDSSDPQTGSDASPDSPVYGNYNYKSASPRYSPNTPALSNSSMSYGNNARSSGRPESSSHGLYPQNDRDSGTSLAGASPRSVPDSADDYGAGGWSGYGGSPADARYGSTAGYGSSSSAAPVDGAKADQQSLPAGVASATTAPNSNAYGAVPSSGAGRGSKDRETRQTWLTADEDFFAVENPGPPPVIDQSYMDELDERDRRRRDWW